MTFAHDSEVLSHESHQVTHFAHLIGLGDSGTTHRSQEMGFHSMTPYESWLGMTHRYESQGLGLWEERV